MMQTVSSIFTQMKPLILGAVKGWHNESTAIGCRVTGTAAQTINNVTVTALTFETEIHDTDGMFTATDTKMYVNTPGYYDMGGGWAMDAANNVAISRVAVLIRKNGDTVLAVGEVDSIANQAVQVSASVGMVYMGPGDYIQILAYHNEGVNVARWVATSRNQDRCFGWIARRS